MLTYTQPITTDKFLHIFEDVSGYKISQELRGILNDITITCSPSDDDIWMYVNFKQEIDWRTEFGDDCTTADEFCIHTKLPKASFIGNSLFGLMISALDVDDDELLGYVLHHYSSIHFGNEPSQIGITWDDDAQRSWISILEIYTDLTKHDFSNKECWLINKEFKLEVPSHPMASTYSPTLVSYSHQDHRSISFIQYSSKS